MESEIYPTSSSHARFRNSTNNTASSYQRLRIRICRFFLNCGRIRILCIIKRILTKPCTNQRSGFLLGFILSIIQPELEGSEFIFPNGWLYTFIFVLPDPTLQKNTDPNPREIKKKCIRTGTSSSFKKSINRYIILNP